VFNLLQHLIASMTKIQEQILACISPKQSLRM
jgi:hypothetical protein